MLDDVLSMSLKVLLEMDKVEWASGLIDKREGFGIELGLSFSKCLLEVLRIHKILYI